MIELFAKVVNGWKLLTIFARSYISDIWQGSEYDSHYFYYLWLISSVIRQKEEFQENKARQIFRKTNISYPLIRPFALLPMI